MSSRVKSFFREYSEALLSLNIEKISSFYAAPMAVYSDQGVMTVDEQKEVNAFWERGIQPYAKMNIAAAEPEIVSEEKLSDKTFTAKVLWVNKDFSGKEIACETNFYILSEIRGDLKITGLVIMAQ